MAWESKMIGWGGTIEGKTDRNGKAAARKAAWRARKWPEGKPRGKPGRPPASYEVDPDDVPAWEQRRKERGTAPQKPFIGVDGEGCGVDELGRQEYRLMCASGLDPLYTGKPLTTAECLEFILSLPRNRIAVGYGFSYDVSMILKDLPPERMARVLAPKESGPGKSRYTYYLNRYGIEYLGKNYIRVCRVKRVRLPGAHDSILRTVKGTTRTVWDVIGCFQTWFCRQDKDGDFTGALVDYSIGREHWNFIARNKANRDNFTEIGETEREYCRIECDMLAELMEVFRSHAHHAGIRPRNWAGAGKLAEALHRHYQTPKRAQVAEWVPSPSVLEFAQAAYYGGRFEITRTGLIEGPIYEYDIVSAYPAAMQRLPCLEHGKWETCTGKQLQALPADSLFVARLKFDHPNRPLLCGLPVRKKDGRLVWPSRGGGIYWSPEIQAAQKLGCVPRYSGGWVYRRQCECGTFSWVDEKFQFRKELKRINKGLGIPLKLAINSLYGKLAQRIGAAVYQNPIWAGLITALTRATLIEAAAQAPDDILMIATDGIYSRKPLTLPIGEELGQFETSPPYAWIFLVQPGVYWLPGKSKTRGINLAQLRKAAPAFEIAWAWWATQGRHNFPHGPANLPRVQVSQRQFVGIRLAHARGKPETAQKWVDVPRQISFRFTDKRQPLRDGWESALALCHAPLDQTEDFVSYVYQAGGGLSEAWDEERLASDEQPDWNEWLHVTVE